jgi:hypothetical protein
MEKKMKFWKLIGLSTLAISVVGCGGGGGSSSSTTGTTTSASTIYNFVTPTLNTRHTFARTIVDNSNNTINQTIVETVTAVNQDGTFVFVREDPNHNSITVGGRNYSIPTSTNYTNSSGQDTYYTYSENNSLVTCTYNPHAAGPTYPFSVGATWSSSWNFSCGSNAPINYTQNGTVVDTESITISAGTFTTFKLQSTISWTNANGTTYTDARTTWKDVNGSHTTIKEQDSYTTSGTTPAIGYPVSMIVVLEN